MFDTNTTLPTIAHVIQLAVAPVFLLSGIGALLAVLTSRLGRIIDRARLLEGKVELSSDQKPTAPILRGELGMLSTRIHLIHIAITLCTISALLICAVIASLFIGTYWDMQVTTTIIVFLFIAAMLSLIVGLLSFLKEIFLAIRSVRIMR